MDQRPTLVTESLLRLPWRGIGARAFGCYLCGHNFEVGDVFRWQLMSGTINFMVCVERVDGEPGCDGDDVCERFRELYERTRIMRMV
jgi:hypothetical protein